MTRNRKLGFLLAVCGSAGCQESKTTQGGVPSDVKAIIFLQRVARNEGVGNVFDYKGYVPGGRIVKLEPPSADGKLTVLTADPMFAGADFMSWDLSFDARTIVFSARLESEEHYQLFTLGVDGTNPRQLTEGPVDYVYPIFLPEQKVMFTTSKVVEPGTPQFQDEYERQTTAQVGVVGMDGSAEALGPRNVSHRVAPALLPDGNVVYTEWLHLGDVNDGHLRLMNTDMTGQREAFGGEGHGITNSFLKARSIESYRTDSGRTSHRLVAVGTSRDNTLQAGKLLLIDLADSEKNAEVRDLTPLVPGDRMRAANDIGRYYDAEPIGEPTDQRFLVSWSGGPVESSALAMGMTRANFGLYVYDARSQQRFPIYDDPGMWDVLARPVKERGVPPVTQSPISGTSFVVGALDVYQSSIFKVAPASAVKVRLLEGFSAEEGFPSMFGLTEFDGQSRYGEVPIYADGSFAARVPANVPVHMQLIDRFALSLASEPVWISGRPGEQRFCGGCHEDRARNTVITPGTIEAVQRGPVDLDVPRAQRVSLDFSYEKVRGVPWDGALQPIFDAKCASCHDGNPARPGNPSFTVTDTTLGTMQTFVFDLRAGKVALAVGERMQYDFPASYVSLVGLGMELGENVVQIAGDYRTYITPGSAVKSDVIKRLNPPQRFPVVDAATRAFPGMPVHPADVGGTALTPDEYYLLILNIDMGAQYYFRENKGAK
jgi:Hydrazine synthase alpha subunit middle domain